MCGNKFFLMFRGSRRLVRCTERLGIADVDHEHQALLAGLEMCDLPDQLLDLGGGRLGVDPGLAGVCISMARDFRSIISASLRLGVVISKPLGHCN